MNDYIHVVMSILKDNRINPFPDLRFKKLFEAAEIAKFTPEEKEAYEESLKYYRDLKNVVDTSREEGYEEGMEKGMEKGKEKGKIEVAIELKKNKVPIEIIIQSTGLSKEEIEKL